MLVIKQCLACKSFGDVQNHVQIVFVREIEPQCMFTVDSVFDSVSTRSLAFSPMFKASH